jgi:hypothetical protein
MIGIGRHKKDSANKIIEFCKLVNLEAVRLLVMIIIIYNHERNRKRRKKNSTLVFGSFTSKNIPVTLATESLCEKKRKKYK